MGSILLRARGLFTCVGLVSALSLGAGCGAGEEGGGDGSLASKENALSTIVGYTGYLNVKKFSSVRDYLKALLQWKAQKNRAYSLRAFARDLDLSPSFVSQYLKGKTELSLLSAQKICDGLKLECPALRRYFLALQRYERDEDIDQLMCVRQQVVYNQLTPEQLPTELSPIDIALLLIASLSGGLKLTSATAECFAREPEELEAICQRLREAGWMKYESGLWHATKSYIQGLAQTDGNIEVRAFHKRILHIGLNGLERLQPAERFFQSSVFSMRSEDYEAHCKRLEDFSLQTCDYFLNRPSHDRIYSLGIQLIPLTPVIPHGIFSKAKMGIG